MSTTAKKNIEIVTGPASDPKTQKVRSLLQRAREAETREEFHESNRLFRDAAGLASDKDIWRWKSLGFCPTTFPDGEAIDLYFKTLLNGLDLAIRENIPMDWKNLPSDGFCPSFNLPHLGRSCKDVREKFCTLFRSAFPQEKPVPKNPDQNGGRWRIGFHALHGHESGMARGSAGIIDQLDKKRFDVFVFVPDRGLEICKKAIHSDQVTFVPLGGTFEEVVKKVRDAECNLIYYRKAGTDPWSYFFPFTNCAPVQVTSYGTHGTSGIAAMDHFLSSSFVEPENGQEYYTETLFNLNSMPTYQFRHTSPNSPVSRDEFGLPPTGSLYFCPHRTGKYHPSFDEIFQRIGRSDPNGRFVLLFGQDDRGRKMLHERLKFHLGENLFKKIILLNAMPFERYKRLLSLVTVMLDSPVYAGGLTSFDAFSFNIPEVTLSGPLHVQNFATGIYRRMGMDHLPCQSIDEYVERAVRLGTDPEYRESVSLEIEANSDKIFGSPEIVSEHERFFELACSRSLNS